MSTTNLFILAFAVLALPLGSARAADYTVPGDFATIQAAIDAAVNGDTVTVLPGLYAENIDFLGKNIVVASAGGPAVTTIDGGGAGSVVRFVNLETRRAVLRGFTLRNGDAFEGGGIAIGDSSPSIEGNIITANRCCDGCGIGVGFGSPLIRNNQIRGNVRTGCSGGNGGGGILLRGDGQAVIAKNVILGNRCGSGGAISLFAAGTPYIANNVMAFNQSDSSGGAMQLFNSADAIIVQNLIYGNSATSSGPRAPEGTSQPMPPAPLVALLP